MYFKLSKCGNHMELTQFIHHEYHDHLNGEPEAYISQNRKLNAEQTEMLQQCVELNGDKLPVMSKIHSQGKIVLFRDYSNLKAKSKLYTQGESMELVVSVLKKAGYTHGMNINKEKEFRRLFFFKEYMRKNALAWFQHLQIDFTHNNLKTKYPVGTILNVEGYGQTDHVGVAILAQETQELLTWFIDTFMKHFPEAVCCVRSVMTDKHEIIRLIMRVRFPNAALYLCSYHVPCIFGRQIHPSHYPGLDAKLATQLLECCQRMMYATVDFEYDHHYQDFCKIATAQVRKPFDDYWKPIQREWVRCHQVQANYKMNTNNRTESSNHQIKNDTNKDNTMVEFVGEFDDHLGQHSHERNARAVDHTSKILSNVSNPALLQYYNHLTRFTYSHCKNQMSLMGNVRLSERDGVTI